MKKILMVIDALNFKAETLDFAAWAAKPGKSKIVGIFVENVSLNATPAIKLIGGQMYVEEITQDAAEISAHEIKVGENKELFKAGCLQREVDAMVHCYKSIDFKDVVHETRYADLIIVDPAISFSGDNSIPSKFAMDLLSNAECPVLIAPEYFEQPQEIVLAYNGSKSSMFAIKQFRYQFPALADKKTTILHIRESEADEKYEKEHKAFTEWLEMHFAHTTWQEISGSGRDQLFKYFMTHDENTAKLLVIGAYGRGMLSSFLKPSTADLVLKAIDIPVFIAHG